MSSELARQLGLIRPKDVVQVERKKAASILYTSTEAVRISRTQIREIGQNGFTELLQLEPRLQEYEEPLFGKHTAQFERGLLTAEDTGPVDAQIERFLRLISPFLERKAAHKAVEHLIRCFEANIYNVDSLLAAALPFHQTDFFGRLVGVCHIAGSSLWHFLERAKRSKAPLVRATLVQQGIKEKGFVDFVASTTLKALTEGYETARPAISFATVLLLEILQRVDSGQENLLRALLAFSLECVSYKTSPEAQAAGLLLLCQFAHRHSLPNAVFQQIVVLICDSLPRRADQRQAVFVALASLFQAQGGAAPDQLTFPKDALLLMLRSQCDICACFEATKASGYRVGPLLLPLTLALFSYIQHDNAATDEDPLKALAALQRLILDQVFAAAKSDPRNDCLSASSAKRLCAALLSAYFAFFQSASSHAAQNPRSASAFRSIMDALVARFSAPFDEAVAGFISSATQATRSARLEFLSSLQSPLYGVLNDDAAEQVTVSMALRHNQAAVRIQAISALETRLQDESESGRLQTSAKRDLLHLSQSEINAKVAARLFGSRVIFAELCRSADEDGQVTVGEVTNNLISALEAWTIRGAQATSDHGESPVAPLGATGASQLTARTSKVCSAIMRRLATSMASAPDVLGHDAQNRTILAVLPFVPLDKSFLGTASGLAKAAWKCLSVCRHPLFDSCQDAVAAISRDLVKAHGKKKGRKPAALTGPAVEGITAAASDALWEVSRKLSSAVGTHSDEDSIVRTWQMLLAQNQSPAHRSAIVRIACAAVLLLVEAGRLGVDGAQQFMQETLDLCFQELRAVASDAKLGASFEGLETVKKLQVPSSSLIVDEVVDYTRFLVGFVLAAVDTPGSKAGPTLSAIHWQVLRNTLGIVPSVAFARLAPHLALRPILREHAKHQAMAVLSSLAIAPGDVDSDVGLQESLVVRSRAWLLLQRMLGEVTAQRKGAAALRKLYWTKTVAKDTLGLIASSCLSELLSAELELRRAALSCVRTMVDNSVKELDPCVRHLLSAIVGNEAELLLDAQAGSADSTGFLLTSTCHAMLNAARTASVPAATFFEKVVQFFIEGAATAESKCAIGTTNGVQANIVRVFDGMRDAASSIILRAASGKPTGDAGNGKRKNGRKGGSPAGSSKPSDDLVQVARECVKHLRQLTMQLMLPVSLDDFERRCAGVDRAPSAKTIRLQFDTLEHLLRIQLHQDSDALPPISTAAKTLLFKILRTLSVRESDLSHSSRTDNFRDSAIEFLAPKAMSFLNARFYESLSDAEIQQVVDCLQALFSQGDTRLHSLTISAAQRLPLTAKDLAGSLARWREFVDDLENTPNASSDECLNKLVVLLDILQLKAEKLSANGAADSASHFITTGCDTIVRALYDALSVLQNHASGSTTTASAAAASAAKPTFLLSASNADFVTQHLLVALRRYVRAVIAEAKTLPSADDSTALLVRVASEEHVQLLMACIQRSLIGGNASATDDDAGHRTRKQQAPTSLQTTNEVLLVLSAVTEAAPGQVVASIPEMLDQVASTALLSTNRWMFHVTNQVVRTVIPAYLSSIEAARDSPQNSSTNGGASIGRLQGVLVGAYKSIPPQNKIPFFSNLAQVLGQEHLASLILCLFSEMVHVRTTVGQSASSTTDMTASDSNTLAASAAEVMADVANDAMIHKLFYHFSPHTQLVVLRQLMVRLASV